ncbi:hypothetical protein C8R43DRAFT_1048707 [Mycena crocata]|nr:hypothetical protein C8R43DRAFT_1048707 [Mycena crocata]
MISVPPTSFFVPAMQLTSMCTKTCCDYFPTFSTVHMFSLPAGSENINELRREGRTVLIVPEPSDVLHRLLSLTYPAKKSGTVLASAADNRFRWNCRNSSGRTQIPVHPCSAIVGAHVGRSCSPGSSAPLTFRHRPALRSSSSRTEHRPLYVSIHGPSPTFPEMDNLSWTDAQCHCT